MDSNVPMYLVGRPHPNRARAREVLTALVDDAETLFTDVEVLQEILHRYTAINRPDAIDPAFRVLLDVVDDVMDLTISHLERTRQILRSGTELSARDAVHLAVMESVGSTRILSFDRGFDARSGIERLH